MKNLIRMALASSVLSVTPGAFASTHTLHVTTTVPHALAILNADGSPILQNYRFEVLSDSTLQPIEIPIMFVSNDPSLPLHVSVLQAAMVAQGVSDANPIPLKVELDKVKIGSEGLTLNGETLPNYPLAAKKSLKVSVDSNEPLLGLYDGQITLKLQTVSKAL